jgi:hypothetical protein
MKQETDHALFNHKRPFQCGTVDEKRRSGKTIEESKTSMQAKPRPVARGVHRGKSQTVGFRFFAAHPPVTARHGKEETPIATRLGFRIEAWQ